MSPINDKKVVINKRARSLPREELEKLSKSALIDKVVQLEAYNYQLKNILQKKLNENDKKDADYVLLMQQLNGKVDTSTSTSSEEKCVPTVSVEPFPQQKRKFNWSSVHKRHILLKVLYFGWDYQGFACQEDSNETIEYHLFRALTRTCLIESRAASNYHRCGRTDKEVSAFCQVISIDVRSKLPAEQQLDTAFLDAEIDYCNLLNRVLPKNIQCIAWMPLRSCLYSARFDCVARTYRYYFPKGDLNIEAMRSACLLLERHTDFRNFCKMDVHNGVTNYVRNLQSARVELCAEELLPDTDNGYAMYYLEIKANAFLWHQIRCIMAVLLLIGQQKEQPSVIGELLDVQKNPCKPQYTPAIGLPLNLFECEFRAYTTRKANYDPTAAAVSNESDKNNLELDEAEPTPMGDDDDSSCRLPDTTDWIYNEENLQKIIENVQTEWTQFSVKCSMIRNVLSKLEQHLNDEFKPLSPVKAQVLLLQDSVKPRQYQQLLQRKRCESLENRIEYFIKKQRLVVQPNTNE